MVANIGSRTSFQQQTDCSLLLVEDRIYKRRVPQHRRLLVNKGTVIKEEAQDLDIA